MLPLLITEKDTNPLLGLNWMKEFGIMISEMETINQLIRRSRNSGIKEKIQKIIQN